MHHFDTCNENFRQAIDDTFPDHLQLTISTHFNPLIVIYIFFKKKNIRNFLHLTTNLGRECERVGSQPLSNDVD